MARDKDTNKKPSSAGKRTPPPKKKREGLKEYFKGVRLEMKKVVWPTKEELRSYTVVVIAACAAFAIAFGLIDAGFLRLLKILLGITV